MARDGRGGHFGRTDDDGWQHQGQDERESNNDGRHRLYNDRRNGSNRDRDRDRDYRDRNRDHHDHHNRRGDGRDMDYSRNDRRYEDRRSDGGGRYGHSDRRGGYQDDRAYNNDNRGASYPSSTADGRRGGGGRSSSYYESTDGNDQRRGRSGGNSSGYHQGGSSSSQNPNHSNNSGGGYRGGGGGYRGGGGRDAHGGGRVGGRGGGRGGRGTGRGRGPDMSGIKSCLSNVMQADVCENFQFFLYSVAVENDHGEQIESRHRRKFLFDLGLWNGLLNDMPDKEKEDLRRVVFFQGSFFYSARKIPGLEPENLSMNLPVSEDAEGDTIKVVQVIHYVTPIELKTKENIASVSEEKLKDVEVSFDKRCNDCTKGFVDVGGLLQHCQQSGHKPVYAAGDNASPGCEPIAANMEVFNSYINGALQRALGERLARWGTEYIDPMNMKEPVDRQGRKLGVRVYEAYSCQFGFIRNSSTDIPRVGLTVDLRAKIVRTTSVLDHLVEGKDPANYNPSHQDQDRARRHFIGEVVISMHDKKCYSVTDLIYNHSANSLIVDGLGISHAEYFARRKSIELKYPDARPMIAVLGRRNQTIFLPPELVAGNELEARVKQQLPMIASYKPDSRNQAIDKIRSYLIPGAQKSKGSGGLLPALGIQLANGRLSAKAEVLPLPMLKAAGIEVPKHKAENWAPLLNKANFNIHPKDSNTMKVIVFHNRKIRGAIGVYNKIRDLVNKYNATYRLSDKPMQIITAGDLQDHWGPVEKCFSDPSLDPENVFVIDFNKPRGATDSAYPVIKQMLTKNGFLSQFVNFNTYDHSNPRDERRSDIILAGVARQILQKTGFRLWWVKIPQSLPTPTVFIGVDVFHAPRVYDPNQRKRVAKASCAAIIVQVFRNSGEQPSQQVELYSKTYARESGMEYELGDALKETVADAMKELDVSPSSCIVWRDGIGDSAFNNAAKEEIDAIHAGLNKTDDGVDRDVPMSYIVAQKRIATKFLSEGLAGEPDGKYGAPSGTLVRGIQSVEHETFYLNGRAPPYSTPKPVRFIVVDKDPRLNQVPIEELTWDLSHDYANWTGPIKVPSVTQMAHKLAELGGSFADCGSNINASKLKNKIHFL